MNISFYHFACICRFKSVWGSSRRIVIYYVSIYLLYSANKINHLLRIPNPGFEKKKISFNKIDSSFFHLYGCIVHICTCLLFFQKKICPKKITSYWSLSEITGRQFFYLHLQNNEDILYEYHVIPVITVRF